MNLRRGNAMLYAALALGAMTSVPALAHTPGRLTGGGSFICTDLLTGARQRVTHGLELHCKTETQSSPLEPNNLEVNFSGGDNFHLTNLTRAECLDTVEIQQPPTAPFDTFVGAGSGTLNGLPALITFVLTDGGEPGTKDAGTFVITLVGSTTPALDCTWTSLTFGNQQAHNAARTQ